MNWKLPGTELSVTRAEADGVEEIFHSMFLAGGMVLSQVSSITGLEPYIIQNWVKRGYLSPPQRKRYSINQVCRIIHINMLKSALPLESVRELLQYVNGALDREDDDIIDDARLYFLFVRLAVRAKQLDEGDLWKEAMAQALKDYREPVPGAQKRIENALSIMLTAWLAAKMRQRAENMLESIQT